MELNRLTLSVFSENCYFYHDDKDCVVFDPGSDFEYIKDFLNSKGLKVKYILLTHTHFDHAGAVVDLQNYSNCEVMCTEKDLLMMDDMNELAPMFGTNPIKIPTIDRFLEDNDEIDFNGVKIKVITTPGHTAGGVCFYIEQDGILISGDTLFLESVGRSDFPTGNMDELSDSIKNKLYSLPDNTLVYPGHGLHTTIGYEKVSNPFVRL